MFTLSWPDTAWAIGLLVVGARLSRAIRIWHFTPNTPPRILVEIAVMFTLAVTGLVIHDRPTAPSRIFTPVELDASPVGAPPDKVVRFESDAMAVPEGEDEILVARSAKAPGVAPAAFYRAALASESSTGYVGSLCRPIDEATALDAIRTKHSYLRQPTPFDLGSRFVAAMMMEDEWDSQAILIETEHEYILFYWDTTA